MDAPPLRMALTPGEPAGVGPDLCIALARESRRYELVAVADPDLLQARAAALGTTLRLREYEPAAPTRPQAPGELTVLPVARTGSGRPGSPDPDDAPYLLDTLRRAVEECRRAHMAALVTGPLQKASINEAGVPFTGHTEFLAELTGTRKVVMMLATPGLRVALATTHLPLQQVSHAITEASLAEVITVLDHDLRHRFGLPAPRILVCGLNPHAGEDGHLGREELEVIGPALERLRGAGIDLRGPLPADTVFTPRHLEGADAVLAMYHDQGLPVLKYAGFGRAVNVTLGLPIIRTSVDHGTALDLAGSGRADAGSLRYAIETALRMAACEGTAA